MKVTTLLLVAAVPTAAFVWMDALDAARSRSAWVRPEVAVDYLRDCEAEGGNPDVCACTANHILVGSPPAPRPSVDAGPYAESIPGERSYRDSCEHWAVILGLVDEVEPAESDSAP